VGTAADSKLNTIKSYTDTLESSQDNIESKVGTVKTTTTTINSKCDTIKGYTDTVESLVTTVKTATDTLESSQDNIESKLDTVKSSTDNVESMLDTNESKIDSLTYYLTDNTTQFEDVVFPKTSGTITADGNDTEELSTTNSQQTSYTTASIMKYRIIGQYAHDLSVRAVYVDLGWTGQVTSGGGPGTGKSKWMVKSGASEPPNLTSAVDLTDELSETTVKASRWRSGQIKLAVMGSIPFNVMLVGKVDNALDTLVCTGYAGSTVSVVHLLQ
jgi:uncharacterized phage infection (PIP) family protein YhgE